MSLTPASARVLTFEAAGRQFAIDAARVAEVTPTPPVTRVPRAPAALGGVANIRGEVAAILDLDRALGGDNGLGQRTIVLQGAERVGLAVARILALADADAGAEAPERLEVEDLLALAPVLTPALTPSLARPERPGRPGADEGTAAPGAAGAELSFLQIRAGGQDYAIPLEEVLETAPAASLRTLPGTDPVMLGVTAWRERLLPVLSVAAALGLPADGGQGALVVVEVGGAAAGLAVEAVRGILRTPADRIGAVPAVVNRAAGEARIEAIIRTPGGLVAVLPTDRLLDEDSSARLRATASVPAAVSAGSRTGSIAHVLFRLGRERFGLPVRDIVAIAEPPQALTPLPGAPAFVRGVMHFRGRILPLIDQAGRFGAGPATSARQRVLVLAVGDLDAGFLVDAVEQVVAIPEDRLQPTPGLAAGEDRLFDRASAIEGEDRLTLLLDAGQLLAQTDRDLVKAAVAP